MHHAAPARAVPPRRTASATRSPPGSTSWGCSGCAATRSSSPTRSSRLPKRQIALFLRHLWATDGSVDGRRKNGRGGRVYYASTSRRLVDDVARLLLRFGISSPDPRRVRKAGYRDGYTLDISGVGRPAAVPAARSASTARAGAAPHGCSRDRRQRTSNTNVDTVPREVWDRVRDVLAEQGMTHREFAAAMGTQFCGSARSGSTRPVRERLGRVAAVLDGADLEMLAANDVLWDEIVVDRAGR